MDQDQVIEIPGLEPRETGDSRKAKTDRRPFPASTGSRANKVHDVFFLGPCLSRAPGWKRALRSMYDIKRILIARYPSPLRVVSLAHTRANGQVAPITDFFHTRNAEDGLGKIGTLLPSIQRIYRVSGRKPSECRWGVPGDLKASRSKTSISGFEIALRTRPEPVRFPPH